MKKKKVFVLCLALGIASFVAAHGYSALTGNKTVEYLEVPIISPKIPEELEGYRVAFITDTHNVSDGKTKEIVEQLNDSQIDLVLLGGDYAKGRGAKKTLKTLCQIDTTDGFYGVDGNNDRLHKIVPMMKTLGIVPLVNQGVYVREHFYLAGVEDLREESPNVERAVANATEEDFVLLLTHEPDVAMLQDMSKVDYVLSGHTHGGQLVFGEWAPALTLTTHTTRYGKRFQTGLCEGPEGLPVYVSNGVGDHALLPRIQAKPQVVIFTFHQETGEKES